MFQNRVRKTECLSDFTNEHTVECFAVHQFKCSDVQLNKGSDVQAFSCSDVQTDYRSINRITDNSNIQSYE